MTRIGDYESLAVMHRQLEHYIPESYNGGDIVVWQGTIERQIQGMADKAADSGNVEYERLLKQFLAQWKENELNGSLNIETLKLLKTASQWASEIPWTFKNYFSVLRDQLRKLISVTGEQLPVQPAQPDDKKGAGKTAPRMNMDLDEPAVSDFGPEEGNNDLEKPADELAANPDNIAADLKDVVDSSAKA